MNRRQMLIISGMSFGGLAAGLITASWIYRDGTASDESVAALMANPWMKPDNTPVNAAEWQNRVLVVNFWASWCPPCVEELPLIDAFWRAHKGQGHQVVALAIDQPSAVKRFLARQALGFPIGMAGLDGTELSKSLGNAAGGLPFTVFFKANGDIWRQKIGQITQDDLAQWVAASA